VDRVQVLHEPVLEVVEAVLESGFGETLGLGEGCHANCGEECGGMHLDKFRRRIYDILGKTDVRKRGALSSSSNECMQ